MLSYCCYRVVAIRFFVYGKWHPQGIPEGHDLCVLSRGRFVESLLKCKADVVFRRQNHFAEMTLEFAASVIHLTMI